MVTATSKPVRMDLYRMIFWDFDGVIKESVTVKTDAYYQLFLSYGRDFAARVRRHHLQNAGMSRFEKLPLYLSWCGKTPTEELVAEGCDEFSRLSFQGVVEAPWVPGAEAYIRKNAWNQKFVVVSATPQTELDVILTRLDIQTCFARVFGAPVSKKNAIRTALETNNIPASECLMVGDARSDLDAARENRVPFLLRRHPENAEIFADYRGAAIRDFLEI